MRRGLTLGLVATVTAGWTTGAGAQQAAGARFFRGSHTEQAGMFKAPGGAGPGLAEQAVERGDAG